MNVDTIVRRTEDFELDGTGASPLWQQAEWLNLPATGGSPTAYRTRAKLLASATGLYTLFECDDRKLACSALRDGDELYNEDVVELFIWPDESRPIYFEYEMSPMAAELVLIIPNRGGEFMGWSPWQFKNERRTRRATSVRGGPKSPGAPVEGWSAEVFVPYALLIGIAGQPKPGTRWRANLCRIDYDTGRGVLHSWSTGITNSFHAFEKFGTIEFE